MYKYELLTEKALFRDIKTLQPKAKVLPRPGKVVFDDGLLHCEFVTDSKHFFFIFKKGDKGVLGAGEEDRKSGEEGIHY